MVDMVDRSFDSFRSVSDLILNGAIKHFSCLK